MNSYSQWLIACFVLACSCAIFAVVGDPHEEEREYLTIEGFKVYVLPVQLYSWEGLTIEEKEDERLRAIRKITSQLKLAVSLLPPDPINELRTRIVFYMDDSCEWGDENIHGRTVKMGGKVRYTPLSPTPGTKHRLGQISISCYSSFVREIPFKGIAIHELAHGWHDLFVPDGFENSKIKSQFAWSKKCLHNENSSYWKKNAGEFFAEMTSSFYFRSKHVPHTDMSMHERNKSLVKSVWQDPPNLENFQPSVGNCPGESGVVLSPKGLLNKKGSSLLTSE